MEVRLKNNDSMEVRRENNEICVASINPQGACEYLCHQYTSCADTDYKQFPKNQKMISHERSPRLERQLRNSIRPAASSFVNYDHTDHEGINNQLNFADFPDSFPGNVRPSFAAEECQQAFPISDPPEIFSYLAGNSFAQATDVWAYNNLAGSRTQYYDPRFFWRGEDVNFYSFAFLPVEINFSDTPNFVHNAQEPTYNYAMFSSHTPNLLTQNDTSLRKQEFYNQTCNCLQHFTSPLNHFPYQEDEHFSAFEPSSEIPLHHYPVSYQKQNTNSPYLAMSDSIYWNFNNCYSEPLMQSIAELSNQTTSNPYLNVVQQTWANQYAPPTQESSQMYEENEEVKRSGSEKSNCMYECNDSILNHPLDFSANGRENKAQWTSIRDDVTTPNPKISDQSIIISEKKLLAHEPLITAKKTCGNTVCGSEKAEVRETFDSNFCRKLKLAIDTAEVKTDNQMKKINVPEHVKAQVDAFIKSPRKAGSRQLVTCPVCGQVLARHSTLKIHLRQHSGDRPFKCSSCSRSFTQRSLLDSHLRTHSGLRPYSCPRCHKTFVHSSALKTHKRRHTGERPHRCKVPGCGLAFTDYSTLSKHSRVHTGERPYRCDICNRRFSQSGNMKKHREAVHNPSKYKKLQKRTARDLV